MEESLKSARFLSRVLSGICGAVLLFAVSPNPQERFNDPIEELRVLVDALDTGAEEFVNELIKRDEALSLDPSDLDEALRHALGAVGMEASSELEFSISSQLDLPEPPSGGAVLYEILGGLEDRANVRVVTAELGDVAERFKSALSGAGRSGAVDQLMMRPRVLAREEGELLREEGFTPYAFTLRIHDPIGTVNFEHEYAQGSLSFKSDITAGFRGWLREHQRFGSLARSDGDPDIRQAAVGTDVEKLGARTFRVTLEVNGRHSDKWTALEPVADPDSYEQSGRGSPRCLQFDQKSDKSEFTFKLPESTGQWLFRFTNSSTGVAVWLLDGAADGGGRLIQFETGSARLESPSRHPRLSKERSLLVVNPQPAVWVLSSARAVDAESGEWIFPSVCAGQAFLKEYFRARDPDRWPAVLGPWSVLPGEENPLQ